MAILSDITRTIEGYANNLSAAFSDLINSGSGPVTAVKTDLTGLATDAGALANSYISSLTSVINNDINTVLSSGGVTAAVNTSLLDQISTLVDKAGSYIEGLLQGVETAPAPAPSPTPAPTVDPLLQAVTSDFQSFMANLAIAAGVPADLAAGTAIPPPVTPQTVTAEQSGGLLSSLTSALTDAYNTSSSIVNNITNAGQQALQSAGLTSDVFTSFENWFLSHASLAWTGFKSYFETVFINPISLWLAGVAQTFDYLFLGGEAPTGGKNWNFRLVDAPTVTTEVTAQDYVTKTNEILKSPSGAMEHLANVIVRGATASTAIGASLEPLVNIISQTAAAANPTELLGENQLVDSVYKGIMTAEAAGMTALKRGISNDDFKTIFNLASWIPDMATAASWLARGIISQGQYEFTANANHVSADYAAKISAGALRPASGAGFLSAAGRFDAFSQGFLPGVAAQRPSDRTLSFYTAQQISPDQAELDLVNHHTIPSPDWFAQASYRGLRSPADVALAATAANMPAEIAAQYLDVTRPALPVRVVTTLLSQKLMTEQEAYSHYARLGYTAADINTLITYAESLTVKPHKKAPTDLTSLALADANGLFNDGAITAQQLQAIYEAHGYSTLAASLAVQYIELKAAAAARRAYATELVNEVDLGLTTLQAAVSSLYAAGYTMAEVVKYEKAMKKARVARVKEPTLAEVEKMWKKGLITSADMTNYLQAQGYNPAWIPLLVELYAPAASTTVIAGATAP